MCAHGPFKQCPCTPLKLSPMRTHTWCRRAGCFHPGCWARSGGGACGRTCHPPLTRARARRSAWRLHPWRRGRLQSAAGMGRRRWAGTGGQWRAAAGHERPGAAGRKGGRARRAAAARRHAQAAGRWHTAVGRQRGSSGVVLFNGCTGGLVVHVCRPQAQSLWNTGNAAATLRMACASEPSAYFLPKVIERLPLKEALFPASASCNAAAQEAHRTGTHLGQDTQPCGAAHTAASTHNLCVCACICALSVQNRRVAWHLLAPLSAPCLEKLPSHPLAPAGHRCRQATDVGHNFYILD